MQFFVWEKKSFKSKRIQTCEREFDRHENSQ